MTPWASTAWPCASTTSSAAAQSPNSFWITWPWARTCPSAWRRSWDVLIALPSSGVHSNGFSLVRKVFQVEKGGLDRRYDDLSQTLGETLLTPTRIYVKPVLALLKAGVRIRSISHITGGGFYENIPRSLAEGMTARIERSAVRVLPIFEIIAREGGIPERDMFNTFNMGVGMCLTVAAEDVDLALDSLADAGENGAYALGEIVRGEGGIELC